MADRLFRRKIQAKRADTRNLLNEAVAFLKVLKADNPALTVSDYWFRLALDEAVENSLRHGSCNNPSKYIFIQVEPFKDTVKLIVEDEGNGFNPASIQNPTGKKNLPKSHGRGVYILRSIADVEWNDKGNCITITNIKSD